MCLLTLLVVQIRHDQLQPPSFVTGAGLEVHTSNGTDNFTGQPCRPPAELLERELPTLSRTRFDAALPVCDPPNTGPFVVDAWSGGRLLWRPGGGIEFQRW